MPNEGTAWAMPHFSLRDVLKMINEIFRLLVSYSKKN
jgi:hypothetical protein